MAANKGTFFAKLHTMAMPIRSRLVIDAAGIPSPRGIAHTRRLSVGKGMPLWFRPETHYTP